MTDKPDRLRLLKNAYLAQVSVLEKQLTELRERLRMIDSLENDAEGLSPSANGTLKYSKDIGLTSACLDAIQTIGHSGVNTATIAKYLKDNGFFHTGKNYYVSVGIALGRLYARKMIGSEKVDGKRLYMVKKQNAPTN